MILILPFVLGTLFIALVVHLVSVLAMPELTGNDIYARISARALSNEAAILSREQIVEMGLPFVDPAFETAICRFDLAEGVIRLRAPLSGTLTLVSLVQKGGGVFFTLSDRAAIKGVTEVLIGTPAQIQAIENADREDDAITELRVRAPKSEGVAFVRVFVPSPSERPRAAQVAAQTTCHLETLQ